jgi:hypothetical protein
LCAVNQRTVLPMRCIDVYLHPGCPYINQTLLLLNIFLQQRLKDLSVYVIKCRVTAWYQPINCWTDKGWYKVLSMVHICASFPAYCVNICFKMFC